MDPSTHSSAPLQYSAALQPLAPATSAVFTALTASQRRQTPAPATANLASFVAHAALQPLAPATSAVFTPPLRRSGGKRQPLPRPISRLVSPMLHCSPRLRPPRVFTPPPFAPVAPSARNGHTTPRSYAELTQMRISTFKTGTFETKTLISTLKPSPFKTKTLISTPKTTISTPEPIMPTSLELYPQPRGFREIRLPCFIV